MSSPIDAQVCAHPIDFDALEKNSFVEGNELRDALGPDAGKPGTKDWDLALMRLVKAIKLARQDLYPCIRKSRVRIMSDAEASAYRFSEWARSHRRQRRLEHDGTRIDTAQLTPEQQRIHDARSQVIAIVNAKLRKSLHKVRRALPPEARRNLLE